jgi:hypothetical protein
MNDGEGTGYLMNKPKNNALVVLGMHRSGTSMLAGCLHLLGANLGNHLMAPVIANESGYFENRDIVLNHDILFRDLGVHWDAVGDLPEGWLDSDAARHAEDKLKSLIERDFMGERLWVVKDPRICRLMPLWIRLLNRIDIHPVFVVMVRHPFEVATSLEKRYQFDLMKGHLLWTVYYRDALNGCLGLPHVMITYDQLLADPMSTLSRISQALDISYPHDIRSQYQSIIDFISPELKYHQIGHATEYENGGKFSQYDWIYQQIRLAQIQAIGIHPTDEIHSSDLFPSDLHLQGIQLALFPLITSVRSTPEFQFEPCHATAMFNNLLEIIGRYERADLSHNIRRERALLDSIQFGEGLYAQVFFPVQPDNGSPYSEENSKKILIAPEEWEKISISIPGPEMLNTRHLRFDPINTQGMVAISAIKVLNSATGQVIWTADSYDSFNKFTVNGNVFILSSQQNLELVCTGPDPQLFLPEIPDVPDCPLMLEVWMKVSRNMVALRDAWSEMTRSLDALREEKKELVSDALAKEKAKEDIILAIEGKFKFQEELTRQYYTELKNIEAKNSDLEYLLGQRTRVRETEQPDNPHQNYLLKSWIGQLENDYKAIRNSARWKTGNFMVRIMEILMFRKKQPLVTDHLDKLFQEYHTDQYIDQENMMRKLTHDLTDMFNSRRWKFGHFIISVVERLIMREKPVLAADHVKGIIDQYRQLARNDFF